MIMFKCNSKGSFAQNKISSEKLYESKNFKFIPLIILYKYILKWYKILDFFNALI